MRKRSNSSTTTQSRRNRRGGSSMGRGRRQTTLRARTPRTSSNRSRTRSRSQAQGRGRSMSRGRGGRGGTTSAAHITTDYDTIREWAERRGGWPATVARTARGEPAGILRIDFPGFSGAGSLKPISWDGWFDKFEESNLAFLFQEKTSGGKQSRFFKLIERE